VAPGLGRARQRGHSRANTPGSGAEPAAEWAAPAGAAEQPDDAAPSGQGRPGEVARPRLRGAVSLSGLVDLRRGSELGLSDGAVDRLLGGPAASLPERLALASPYELLPLGVPQLLIHGQLDRHVPIELSRRYAERAAALGDPVELVELPATGHFELIDPECWQGREVLDRIERMLAEG
jgi:pimeloyl-ACP methyl ester carboxylesterase